MLKFEKTLDRLKDEDGYYTNWFRANGVDENENEKKGGATMEDGWDNARRNCEANASTTSTSSEGLIGD
ncbi:hypothetical protein WN943_018933 [Citrus x changshan-huyou]